MPQKQRPTVVGALGVCGDAGDTGVFQRVGGRVEISLLVFQAFLRPVNSVAGFVLRSLRRQQTKLVLGRRSDVLDECLGLSVTVGDSAAQNSCALADSAE